ncbi:MAG TPA: hypothetical protein VJ738_16900 [Steroidobacteraceae bacterium]|nr:hypothetical protein [Steroidobacteraceae bacterium]
MSVTPIRPDVEYWEIWPGIHQVDKAGARLAQDMLAELETYDPTADVSVANRSCLEDWFRDGGPFRNIVAEYMATAQAAGPQALEGFCAVLSDFIAQACTGSVCDAAQYNRWTGDGQEDGQ